MDTCKNVGIKLALVKAGSTGSYSITRAPSPCFGHRVCDCPALLAGRFSMAIKKAFNSTRFIPSSFCTAKRTGHFSLLVSAHHGIQDSLNSRCFFPAVVQGEICKRKQNKGQPQQEKQDCPLGQLSIYPNLLHFTTHSLKIELGPFKWISFANGHTRKLCQWTVWKKHCREMGLSFLVVLCWLRWLLQCAASPAPRSSSTSSFSPAQYPALPMHTGQRHPAAGSFTQQPVGKF